MLGTLEGLFQAEELAEPALTEYDVFQLMLVDMVAL